MKLLVCVDGSAQSTKAVVKAVEIASGCRIDQVTLLHVHEEHLYPITEYNTTQEIQAEIKKNQELNNRLREDQRKMLDHAAMRFREKGIEPDIVMKDGHAAHTIATVAEKEGYDMIVMGSRGSGGLKKLLLGSVSNAVIQETHASVLVVK